MRMSLKETIISDLTAAMKAKDVDKLSTLRMVKANLMNRQIDKGSDLTDDEVLKTLHTLVKQRRDSIDSYEKAGRPELAAKEAAEIVHIGQAIMMQPPPNNTLMYFINTTFNYPTMAEAYRVAALNGYNRLF